MTDRFKPSEQRRQDLEAIADYVQKAEDGRRASWLEIERATGVSMSGTRGRGLFRLVCRKLDRAYVPLPGNGVEFSAPGNALEIAQRSISRAVSAIDAVPETIGRLERHLPEMSSSDRAALTARSAMFAAINVGRQATLPERPENESRKVVKLHKG